MSLSKNIQLGEVARVIPGYAFKSSEFDKAGVPVIKIANIKVGYIDLTDSQFVDPSYIKKLNPKFQVLPGDILISLTGSQITQPNSVVGRVAKQGRHIGPCLLNQRAGKVMVTRPDICDSGYLFWTLFIEEARTKIAAMAHGAASQANVSPGQIESLEINLPQIGVQKRIASILSAYDDLIENNLRRIAILEEMARRIYEEWFVHFRFPGHEHSRFADSPLGRIPEGWEVKKVGEILKKVKRGAKIQKQDYVVKGLIPVVDQGKEFIGGYTDNEESLIFEDIPLIVFGDHTRALKFIDFPFACGADGTQLLKSSDERMPMTLFYYALSHIDLSDFAYARHFKFLKEEILVLPEKSIADLFDQFVSPLRELIRLLMKKNANLRTTRDLLLPKLISGEIDVSEVSVVAEKEVAA